MGERTVTRMSIPNATLEIECAAINPPKPVGCGVFVGKDQVAVITLEELRKAANRLEALENDPAFGNSTKWGVDFSKHQDDEPNTKEK